MITLTTKVARKIMRKQGVGSILFNDKLADGSRSLKVWGWGVAQYEKAKRKLEKKGCTVKMVQFQTYGSARFGVQGRVQTRLHVTEPQD